MCFKKSINLDFEDAELFAIRGKYVAKVVDIYDGDTITVLMYFRGILNSFKIRMYGYDSPEMKPLKSTKNRESIIEKAKESKQFLKNILIGKYVILDCFGKNSVDRVTGKTIKSNEKWGRVLARVYLSDEQKYKKLDKLKNSDTFLNDKCLDINTLMVREKYGVEYYGGTKN